MVARRWRSVPRLMSVATIVACGDADVGVGLACPPVWAERNDGNDRAAAAAEVVCSGAG